ncbi:ImmA/IrrE family metallo-endopeptidase [Agromyces mediolanus]|uniref:ImmA/IrrE family metallo-endopeptidase n=1 Tax=Agromyces mediolanus TaxID=41986 RepID=UPI00203C9E2E|nr:ImmA/IrrE family metallo-endopeptidase [Agromyces mediolanus]MCM3657774.1 ImmA/IrrE family metallo-endopeptidase [Agromyces mediolanus]
MRELVRVAASMGLRLHCAHLPDDTLGYYAPDEARIYFDMRLTPIERRSVVAHELGHAHYGHTCSNASTERQAKIYAARLLINARDYAGLERVNPDQHHLAEELGVTAELVEIFETYCLTRLRGVTYALPKMGVGQATLAAAPAY